MNNRFFLFFRNHFLKNQWLEIAARYLLAGIFIYASFHKITAPAEFAKMVYGYGLFPGEIINLIAIIVPFVEFCAGLMLMIGIWIRSTTLVINTMLIIFIVLISINLIRGHQFDCGCFAPNDIFSAETPWQTLCRDLVLLTIGWYVYQFKTQRWQLISKPRK